MQHPPTQLSVFPASAGMIPMHQLSILKVLSVPRECGDDPQFIRPIEGQSIVFPASAGMIPISKLLYNSCCGVPRECGDDPLFYRQ